MSRARQFKLAQAIVVYATLAVMLATAVFFSWRVARHIRGGQAEAQAWVDARRGPNVIGKTPEQLLKAFGEPYANALSARREPPYIMYKDVKYGTGCRIDFENGKAARVSFWSQ